MATDKDVACHSTAVVIEHLHTVECKSEDLRARAVMLMEEIPTEPIADTRNLGDGIIFVEDSLVGQGYIRPVGDG